MTAATIETSIRSAIEARVATLPMKAMYPVVWVDGPSYNPGASTPYIRASFFPNTTRRMFLNGADPHQRLSLLQLDFMAPKSWTGVQATQVAGQIAAHFSADLRMTFGSVTARVTAAPHVAAPIAGDVFIQVPVSIGIETFA
jgi:hypothetical protein